MVPSPRAHLSQDAASSDSTSGKIQEIVADETSPETLPAPAYAVEPRVLGSGEGGGSTSGVEGEPEGLGVKVHLPLVEHADELEVRLSSETLEVLAPSKYS